MIKREDYYKVLAQEFPNNEYIRMFLNSSYFLALYAIKKDILVNMFKCFLNTKIIVTKISLLKKGINESLLKEVFGLNEQFLEDNCGNTKLNFNLQENKLTYYGDRYGKFLIDILFENISSHTDDFSLCEYPFELDYMSEQRKNIIPLSPEETIAHQIYNFQQSVFRDFKYAQERYSLLETICKVLEKYDQSKKTGEILDQELPITITFTYSDELPKKIHFKYLRDYMTYVKSDKLSQHFSISFLK